MQRQQVDTSYSKNVIFQKLYILRQAHFTNLNNSVVHKRLPQLIIILRESITYPSITARQTNGMDFSMQEKKDATKGVKKDNSSIPGSFSCPPITLAMNKGHLILVEEQKNLSYNDIIEVSRKIKDLLQNYSLSDFTSGSL